MIKYIYVVVVFIFLSCESRINYKKPKDLIPKEQMIDLLTDIHLVNGVTGVKSKDDLKTENYMSLIYEKYQIDSTRFATSNLYYVSNIGEYEKMFEEVEKRLESQQYLFDIDSITMPEREASRKKLKRLKIKKRNKDSILK